MVFRSTLSGAEMAWLEVGSWKEIMALVCFGLEATVPTPRKSLNVIHRWSDLKSSDAAFDVHASVVRNRFVGTIPVGKG